MAGLPTAVIERAKEIAETLSGQSDVEARVPLRKPISKQRISEHQLTFLE